MISSEQDNSVEYSTITDLIRNNLLSTHSKIFQDERVLSDDYLPKTLPYREPTIKHFGKFCKGIIKPHLYQQHFCPLIIRGESGTGKTTLTKLCIMQLINIAQTYGIHVHYVHLNCRKIQKVYVMLLTILKTLQTFYRERGYSHEELFLQLQNLLEHSNTHLVLVFDDLDAMLRMHDTREFIRFVALLTQFFEAPATFKEKISHISINRQSDFFFRLDIPTRILVQSNEIDLPIYTRDQLRGIFQMRIELAFQPNVVPKWFTSALVDVLTCLKQDIRTGLNLLLNIGRTAEFKDIDSFTAEDLREVLHKMYDWDMKVEHFPLEEQIILLTLAKLLDVQKELVAASITHVKPLYASLCSEYHSEKVQAKNFELVLQKMNTRKGILLYCDSIILCYPVNFLFSHLKELSSKYIQSSTKFL